LLDTNAVIRLPVLVALYKEPAQKSRKGKHKILIPDYTTQYLLFANKVVT
jgi:hypothetical protein